MTLDALIGLVPQSPTPATAARHHTQEITATVKRDDLPELAPGPLTRILWNGAEYEVTETIDAPAAQLTTLHARRIG